MPHPGLEVPCYLVVDVNSVTTMLLKKLLRVGLVEDPVNGEMQPVLCKAGKYTFIKD